MKRFGLFLLATAITLGLAACGGTEETETSATSEETTTQGETTTTQGETAEEATSTDAEEFTLTATNWEFTSDKELVVKKGTNVKLNLVNKEGVHTIGSEELGFDLDAKAPVEFTAETVGEFDLICTTICGASDDHEAMKITLKVVE